MGRGTLTDKVKAKAVEVLGREISQHELRLMPYVISSMMDYGRLMRERMSDYELDILKDWAKEGLTEGPSGSLKLTEETWVKFAKIVYVGYVALED